MAVLTIDFDATVYTELITWVWYGPVSQPPLLRDLSDAELRSISDTPMVVLHYLVHTQAAESRPCCHRSMHSSDRERGQARSIIEKLKHRH